MPRYEFTKIKKSKKTHKRNNSVDRYTTTIYEKVPERNSDIFILTQEGDRLDNLANEFYGNPNLWWFIAQTNNISTMNVPANTSLRIPVSTEFAGGG